MVVEDEFGLVGRRLEGRYDIERLVSVGGFGTVYFGRHHALRNAVAVKVLRLEADLSDEDHREFTERFLEEARTLGALRHPAVVRAVDFGVSPMPDGRNAPWMALEWVDGKPLRDVLLARRDRPMAPREALALLRPVFEALAESHAAGIAHRDIKPANIMVTGEAALPTRVIDFGIAKVMASEERTAPSGNTATASADIAFSARYAAPEQVGAARTGPWTDVHALGLVLTEMLTGRDAYAGEESVDLAASALSPQRPTPARFGVDVGAWEPVLARALAFKAAERYPDATSFLAALDEALARSPANTAETPQTAKPAEPPKPAEAPKPAETPAPAQNTAPEAPPATPAPVVEASRRPRAMLVGVAMAAVLGVVLLATTRTPRATPPRREAFSRDASAAPHATTSPARRRCRAPMSLAPIAGLDGATQLSAGGNHTCARLRDGTVRCWGENSDGQLGDGTTEDRATPVAVVGLTGVTQVAAGTSITCALRADRGVWCWGRGIVPNSGEIQNLRPSRILGVRDATQVTAGLMHACALRADGTAWCWGQNDRGQLGGGNLGDAAEVVQVAGIGAVAELVAGEDHTCARTVDDAVWCWGRQDHGELGDGTRARGGRARPARVEGIAEAAQVAVSDGYSCARLRDGTVWCWGNNRDGQLGDGTDVGRATPARVAGVTGAVDLVLGSSHACARRGDGASVCWGGNTFCATGAASIATLRTPTEVPELASLTTTVAGQSHACGLARDGAARCWGWNRFGQLGNGATSDEPDTE